MRSIRAGAMAAVVASSMLMSGCATLFGGGSSQAVSVSATPTTVNYVIKSSSGLQMASGQTPNQVKLPRRNEYEIEFTAPGFQPQKLALTKGLNGWIWANILIGGIPGLIIDFASGSAHKLEPSVISVSLVKPTAGNDEDVALRVQLYNEAGKLIRDLQAPLVPVGK